MTAFVGRDLELSKLKELARLGVASLVVIKGRRRVGKSQLASEFAARHAAATCGNAINLEAGVSI